MSDKKYLSRKVTRLAAIFLYSGSGLGLFGVLFHAVPLAAAGMILLIPAGVLAFRANRCPYCGTGFRGFYWSKPSAGYCNKCGKMMVFDDFAEGKRKE